MSCAGGPSFDHRARDRRDSPFELFCTREAHVGFVLEVRALRPVSRPVSDVSSVGYGDGFATRPHLPDRAGGRRPSGVERFVRHPHRSLPWLPELPDRVPVGRGLRQPAGAGAGADRRKLPASVAGYQVAPTLLCRRSAVVSPPRTPRAFYKLLT